MRKLTLFHFLLISYLWAIKDSSAIHMDLECISCHHTCRSASCCVRVWITWCCLWHHNRLNCFYFCSMWVFQCCGRDADKLVNLPFHFHFIFFLFFLPASLCSLWLISYVFPTLPRQENWRKWLLKLQLKLTKYMKMKTLKWKQ